MMLRDYRESFAADLRDPEFQKEFIMVSYDEDGPEGVMRALRVIASANQDTAPLMSGGSSSDFNTLRSALNALNLDIAIVRK